MPSWSPPVNSKVPRHRLTFMSTSHLFPSHKEEINYVFPHLDASDVVRGDFSMISNSLLSWSPLIGSIPRNFRVDVEPFFSRPKRKNQLRVSTSALSSQLHSPTGTVVIASVGILEQSPHPRYPTYPDVEARNCMKALCKPLIPSRRGFF